MPSNSDDDHDHDLREVPPGMHHDGAALGDFAPGPDEPDLDIWPRPTDKGAETFSGNPEDLVPIFNSYPEPHVRWLTAEQFQHEFGYPPETPEDVVADAALRDIAEDRRLTLTQSRQEFFERLARLWNGELVGPEDTHLLVDKIPSWDAVFGDIDQRHLAELRPTVRKHDDELVSAFGRYSWFEPEHHERGWVRSTYIARAYCAYDIEERTRTLITKRDDLPDLIGDPHEGLKHRFGVGCEAARARFRDYRDVQTYVSIGDYTVDLLERDSNRNDIVGEMLTDHNNNRLYRDTYHKLAALQCRAIIIFDSRSTLRRVLNHWQDWGVDVPGAPFNSAPNLDWLRKKFQAGANDPATDWSIEDVLTVTQAWDIVFGADPAPGVDHMLSLDW